MLLLVIICFISAEVIVCILMFEGELIAVKLLNT